MVDKSPQAQGYVAGSYPGVSTESEYERVLADRSIDAVVIATPAADHYRAARLSLMAGKHVFVEKPLAQDAEEAEALVAFAHQNDLVLMAGHTFLYNSAVRKVKELLDLGELGDIYYISSRRLDLGVVRRDVNALWDLAPHDVSIVMHWLGEEPAQSTAFGGAFLQPGIEDVVFLNMAFASGAIASIQLSWLDPHRVRNITVVGSKKMVVFDDVSLDAQVTIFNMGIDVERRVGVGTHVDSFADFQFIQRLGDTVIPRISYPEPLMEEMKHFISCVRTGEEPLTGGEHAIGVVRALQQAHESLKRSAGTSMAARHGDPSTPGSLGVFASR